MRYLGNKESLLHFIDGVLAMHGVHSVQSAPLAVCDPFTGTTAVARHLKRQWWRVISGDTMTYSYALQHAYIGLNNSPPFTSLLASGALDPAVHAAALGRVVWHRASAAGNMQAVLIEVDRRKVDEARPPS